MNIELKNLLTEFDNDKFTTMKPLVKSIENFIIEFNYTGALNLILNLSDENSLTITFRRYSLLSDILKFYSKNRVLIPKLLKTNSEEFCIFMNLQPFRMLRIIGYKGPEVDETKKLMVQVVQDCIKQAKFEPKKHELYPKIEELMEQAYQTARKDPHLSYCMIEYGNGAY